MSVGHIYGRREISGIMPSPRLSFQLPSCLFWCSLRRSLIQFNAREGKKKIKKGFQCETDQVYSQRREESFTNVPIYLAKEKNLVLRLAGNHFSRRWGSRPLHRTENLYVLFCFCSTAAHTHAAPERGDETRWGFLYEHLQITVDYIINLTIKYKNLVITR